MASQMGTSPLCTARAASPSKLKTSGLSATTSFHLPVTSAPPAYVHAHVHAQPCGHLLHQQLLSVYTWRLVPAAMSCNKYLLSLGWYMLRYIHHRAAVFKLILFVCFDCLAVCLQRLLTPDCIGTVTHMQVNHSDALTPASSHAA